MGARDDSKAFLIKSVIGYVLSDVAPFWTRIRLTQVCREYRYLAERSLRSDKRGMSRALIDALRVLLTGNPALHNPVHGEIAPELMDYALRFYGAVHATNVGYASYEALLRVLTRTTSRSVCRSRPFGRRNTIRAGAFTAFMRYVIAELPSPVDDERERQLCKLWNRSVQLTTMVLLSWWSFEAVKEFLVPLVVRNPALAVLVTQRLGPQANDAGGPSQFTVCLVDWVLEQAAIYSPDAAQAYAIGLWNSDENLLITPTPLPGAILRYLESTISTYDRWVISTNPFKPGTPRDNGHPVHRFSRTNTIMRRAPIPQRLTFPRVRDVM